MNGDEETTRRPRVLVIDDDPDVGRLITDLLASEGIDVTFVTTPGEVLAHIVDEDFDAVFTDLYMPEMDGVSLCERFTASRPDVPVIVFSAKGTLETVVAARRAGAVDFITKPLFSEPLRSCIRRALAHREQRTHLTRMDATTGGVDGVVGESVTMKHALSVLDRAAATSASILLTGETGTGKEVVARAIHRASARRDGPFVPVNCAALTNTILESELFGHVKGAFTGAETARRGLCLDAHGGTLFLDEIGELALESQTKLLRALQERTVRPVGADEEIRFDARIIAATNRDLEREVVDGGFREDLFFRLAVIRLEVPALRDRGEEDILPLAAHFLRSRADEREPLALSEEAIEKLAAYDWPGNVRELENAIERATVLARGDLVESSDLPEHIQKHDPRVAGARVLTDVVPLEEFARAHLLRVLEMTGGNKTKTAELLGIGRRTLRRRLEMWKLAGDSASEPPEE